MLSHMDDFSRQLVFLFYGIDTVLEVIVRFLIRYVLVRMRKNGMNLKRILLVGYSRAAERVHRPDPLPIPSGGMWSGESWMIVLRRGNDVQRSEGASAGSIICWCILPQNHLDEIAITLGLNEYYKLERIVGLV